MLQGKKPSQEQACPLALKALIYTNLNTQPKPLLGFFHFSD
jgi:hypothetical protein